MDKEQQKKLLIEIMEADEKDRLYEQQNVLDWFKQQIMKAYNDGYRDGMTDHGDKSKDISEFDNARLYYNETYSTQNK